MVFIIFFTNLSFQGKIEFYASEAHEISVNPYLPYPAAA